MIKVDSRSSTMAGPANSAPGIKRVAIVNRGLDKAALFREIGLTRTLARIAPRLCAITRQFQIHFRPRSARHHPPVDYLQRDVRALAAVQRAINIRRMSSRSAANAPRSRCRPASPPTLRVPGRHSAYRRYGDNSSCLSASPELSKTFNPSAAISSSKPLANFQSSSSKRLYALRTKSKASGAASKPNVEPTPAPKGEISAGSRSISATPIAVHRPGAAEGEHRHAPRVLAALDGVDARRASHVLVDNLMDPPGGRSGVMPSGSRQTAERFARPVEIQPPSCRRENISDRDNRARDRRQ